MTDTFKKPGLHIVGGGLAGSEAAWQAAHQGVPVFLYEMRDGKKSTPAHKTSGLAELVCSNSFKSIRLNSVPGLLKFEMEQLNSVIIAAAKKAQIPAGQALAVDRLILSATVEEQLANTGCITRVAAEVTELPSKEEMEERGQAWILATGPLTSEPLYKYIQSNLLAESTDLAFYDAIAPVIEADSIDYEKTYFANRYEPEKDDYLNIPLNKEIYDQFISDVQTAEYSPLHAFESTPYFEACLPIEVMAKRGPETLRFGPLKPVGLEDPKTGEIPHAAIQLRRENADATMFSMVGFQTKMKWPEQKRVFQKIPGLENAVFYRYGSVHRNSYLNSPKCLNENLSFCKNNRVFLAGQISGVEGYTESTAIGLLAGRLAAAMLEEAEFTLPPPSSVIGSLHHYVTKGVIGPFQPMNANFGLLPKLEKSDILKTGKKRMGRRDRRDLQCVLAKQKFEHYFENSQDKNLN